MSDNIRVDPHKFEYFESRQTWEDEFKSATCRVEEWRDRFPDQFAERTNGRGQGRLGYFFQYALQYVLRRDYGISSITWMHMGAAEPSRKARNQLVPKGLTGRKRSPLWDVMRQYMGNDFDRLQRTLISTGVAGKGGGTGEPDLFCFREQDAVWFFAEAKCKSDSVHESQVDWWKVAEKSLGTRGRPFLCRILPEGCPRPNGCPKHTARWSAIIG